MADRGTSRKRQRIGIFGGTFDPVHYAHLAIAEEVYQELKLDRLVFVPAGHPPHKAGLRITSAEQRVEMLRLAIASNPHFTLSLVDVQRSGPSYTVDTLRLLRREWGRSAELFFIIGGDSLKDLPAWHDPEGILAQATLVALMRPGYLDLTLMRPALEKRLPALKERLILLEGPQMDISSTNLRQRAALGRSIRYQTPDAVEAYIIRQGLYRQETGLSYIPSQEHIHATNAI